MERQSKESQNYQVYFVTAGKEEEADLIAKNLVDKNLAACVNIIPNIKSIYRWKGKVESDKEFLLIIKSHSKLEKDLVENIKSMHSYDTPEVIALPIVGGSSSYLQWLGESLRLDN